MSDTNSSFKPDPTPFNQITFHDNTSQVLIRITEDKLKNYLNDFLKSYEIRFSWKFPLGFLIPIIITLITATFKAKFGLTSEMWEVVFILLLIGSIIWFLKSLITLKSNFKISTLDFIIDKIKNG
jgi:hypothetical protein